MKEIRKFSLQDVRCFADKVSFDIRPLTFLVGENSTGKSTVLGCFQALFDEIQGGYRSDIDFNVEPYQMGAFTNIVRRSNPIKDEFKVGIEVADEKGKASKYFLTLKEKASGSEPIICRREYIFDEGVIAFSLESDDDSRAKRPDTAGAPSRRTEWTVKQHGRNEENNFEIVEENILLGNLRILDRLRLLYEIDGKENLERAEKNLFRFWKQINFDRRLFFSLPAVQSIAPIRSKPKRTYDPLKENASPDGGEIPMTLRNLSAVNPKRWNELIGNLVKFGKKSGLFTDVAVRKLGESSDNPFQLRIKVRGPKVNLMDVGYGVSQILPILVRILMGSNSRFLLQQPEVHLHPKGQAELASLLVNRVVSAGNSFIIETHSNYMIDRVRIDIMQGRIKPDEVSLIYLEAAGKAGNKVKVHNIRFDAQANMIDVPPSYGEFFFRETNQLLGFD